MTWRTCTLGEVVRFQRGHDLPDQDRKPGDVPVIGSAGQNGWHNEAIAKGPGVSIGRSGASIGKVTYTAVDYWPHNACLYVTDFLGNNPRFVYYFLKTKGLSSLNSGAAQPSLNRNFVHAVQVKVPGPNEQAAITEILSAYDDLIENNWRRIALLEEAARTLYREWFVRFRFPGHDHVKIIDGIPEGWERVSPNEFIADHIGGGWGKDNPEGKETEPAYVIRGTDIPDIERGNISEVGLRFHGLAQLKSRKLAPYNIIFEVSGGSTNQPIARTLILTEERLKQWNVDVICASFCKKFGFKSSEDAVFFYFHAREYRDRGDILKYQKESASSLKNFNFEAFMGTYRMTVPPGSLRRLFFESASDFLRQQCLLSAQIIKLARARDLLLPRLMNSEIAV